MPVTSQDTFSWTTVGPQDVAQNTYTSIKHALSSHPNLTDKSIEVFLQGSYANSTNTRGDSDVDVVVMSKETFFSDTDKLSFIEKAIYEQQRIPATYHASDLRRDVLTALRDYYGSDRVEEHNKCIRVLKREGYVDADVVPAFQYRLYHRFGGAGTDYTEGTTIIPVVGDRVINYPKEHKKNGSSKNDITFGKFKPSVRQLKNLKRHVVDQGLIDPKDVPGYLLECLTYNVPNPLFGADHHSRLNAVLDWLTGQADYSQMKSVDNIHTLFGTDPGNFSEADARRTIGVLKSQVGWY